MTARQDERPVDRARRPDPTTDADCYLQLPVVVVTKHFRTIDDVDPILHWVRLLSNHGWLAEKWTAVRELLGSGLPAIRVRRRRREAFLLTLSDHVVLRDAELVRVDHTKFVRSHQPLPMAPATPLGLTEPLAVTHITPHMRLPFTAERCG